MSDSMHLTDELERERLDYIEDAKNGTCIDWDELSKPGGFGCHELLDRTNVLASQVEDYIVTHPACLNNPEWFALAVESRNLLSKLYHQVGNKHL